MVFLSWLDEDGTKITAKKVALNAPVPAPAAVLPKNVKWSQKGYDEDAEFAGQIWSEKKESDPGQVSPAQEN
jgi:hypothetical protein